MLLYLKNKKNNIESHSWFNIYWNQPIEFKNFKKWIHEFMNMNLGVRVILGLPPKFTVAVKKALRALSRAATQSGTQSFRSLSRGRTLDAHSQARSPDSSAQAIISWGHSVDNCLFLF